MSLPIYQRVAVTDAGDVIPGAEYTVINENTGVAQPIYSDRNGTSLKSAPYFADSVGTIQFFIAQGTTFRVAASGGVGTYTDRYVYGVAEAVLVQADGNVSFADNQKVNFGAGSDLQIYHDGSNSYIDDAGTGELRLRGSAVTRIQSYAGEDMVVAVTNGAVNLYHNNSKKLETTSTGIGVTGNVGIGTNSPNTGIDVQTTNYTYSGTTYDIYGIIGLTAGGVRLGGDSSNADSVIGTTGTGNMQFVTYNGSSWGSRMTLDSSGNVGIGTSSPISKLHVEGAEDGTGGITIGAGAQKHQWFLSSDYVNVHNIATTSTSAAHTWQTGGIEKMRLDAAGHLLVGTTTAPPFGSANFDEGIYVTTFVGDSSSGIYFGVSGVYPAVNGVISDNQIDLGNLVYRWDDVYATNGTIQTSDRNEKQDIKEITEAETAAAKACKGLLRSFRWKDAVAEKGDDARIHFGIIAQDLQDAFIAEGLDAGRYAMFILGTWWETQTEVPAVEAVEGVEFVQAVEASEALYSEDGELVSEAVEAVEGVEGVEAVEAAEAYTRTDKFDTLAEAPAGATERTRLGVRYTELLAFIIAAI